MHRLIDFSIPRPGLDVRAPGETLRAVIARGATTTIRVIGTETTVQATFTLTAHAAALARKMRAQCTTETEPK